MDACFYEVKPGYKRTEFGKRKWIRYIILFVCAGDYIYIYIYNYQVVLAHSTGAVEYADSTIVDG